MRKWLFKIRRAKDFTMAEVAKKADISESYYSMIENGNRDLPVRTAKRIASVLGFDWTLFYENNTKTGTDD